jgi:hypothetical protein
MAPSEERLAQLRSRVDLQQQEFRAAVDDLENATRRLADPLWQVQAHPFGYVAAAFVFGVWLGRVRLR